MVSAPESDRPPAPQVQASHVTSTTCRGCHPVAFESWSGSHHDRAMQPARDDTVLGDFDQALFQQDDTQWVFDREDEHFVVRIEEPSAAPARFEIGYTFGVEPLQQYLVALPDGRVQALPVAWDTRSAERGGQRWFSLQPEGSAPPGDVLHWTGAGNRWNSMCADCHSTDVRKNFDLQAGRYDTEWSEIDVACEACHGPGSGHVAWAEAGADPEAPLGLVGLGPPEGRATWVMNPDTGIAARVPPRSDHTELDTCAPCHARRSRVAEHAPGDAFLDAFRPALLSEGLYFPDGQIQDEVYVYGSFLQSKMYAAGVSCSDCHDAHSLALRAEGNALCATCHAPERFAQRSHHHHRPESPGAQCNACHMPSRTYMEIDERRDHSFRVPRPELSGALGIPNACDACHAERDADWATKTVRAWFPKRADNAPVARGLAGGRRGEIGASGALRDLARLEKAPDIARATAVASLAGYPSPASAAALRRAAADPNPLVRSGAARAAASLPPPERPSAVGALVADPLRSVRIEAARALADLPLERLPATLRSAQRQALAEYRAAQHLNADDPSAHVNLGLLARAQGDLSGAEAAYRRAIEVGDYFIPARVNLADLYREQGRDDEAESVLRDAARREPDSAEVHHSLGLLLVRLERPEEALASLRRAYELAPDSTRVGYVYGIALNSYGQGDLAIATLESTHDRRPADPAVLQALVSILRDLGRDDEARRYAGRLRTLRASEIE